MEEMGLTVPELKEQLTHLGVDWKQGMLKGELERLVVDNTPAEEIVSDSSSSSISDAPDVDEALPISGRAELNSQNSNKPDSLCPEQTAAIAKKTNNNSSFRCNIITVTP